jgi:CHAT domain-containing protein
LRQLALEPILQRIPSRIQRLIIASDDALHLVPLEALPWQKSLVGDYYQIRMTPTLSELVAKENLSLAEPSLVVAGGIDYDTPAEKHDPALAPNLVAAAIPVDPSQDLVSGKFAYLHGTRQEILAIRELFENTFGKQALVLQDSQATKERLTQLASRARYLHVATHGYYAPEVAAAVARQSPSPVSEITMSGLPETVRGLSPSLLCGLALSGANLPADAIGRTAGIITAEELALLDLAGCELAVLSACETNVGLVQGGQGMASLQKALHAGGARLTITSLWSVPDDATKELMAEFYRQVWVEHQPIAEALWRAKKNLREKKDAKGKPAHPLLDWAGFVLVGTAH